MNDTNLVLAAKFRMSVDPRHEHAGNLLLHTEAHRNACDEFDSEFFDGHAVGRYLEFRRADDATKA